MSKPEGFSAVPVIPDSIERMAREAAGEAPPARPKFPVKDSTKTMSVNMPKAVYDQLREFMKLTDIAMSEVIVAGTIAELARLKKQHKI
jgi:hypothetical protein